MNEDARQALRRGCGIVFLKRLSRARADGEDQRAQRRRRSIDTGLALHAAVARDGAAALRARQAAR